MTEKAIIKTERLILREWRKEDIEPLARLNVEPSVMQFLFRPLTRSETIDRFEVYRQHIRGSWMGALGCFCSKGI